MTLVPPLRPLTSLCLLLLGSALPGATSKSGGTGGFPFPIVHQLSSSVSILAGSPFLLGDRGPPAAPGGPQRRHRPLSASVSLVTGSCETARVQRPLHPALEAQGCVPSHSSGARSLPIDVGPNCLWVFNTARVWGVCGIPRSPCMSPQDTAVRVLAPCKVTERGPWRDDCGRPGVSASRHWHSLDRGSWRSAGAARTLFQGCVCSGRTNCINLC